MNGFLNLLKPPGMTSHDVVQQVRRICQTRAVGHTGTLDPAAAGVLVLTVGYATRLGEFLSESEKAYRAEITLGLRTDTADAEGAIISSASTAEVTEQAVRQALQALTGEIVMRPPAHSAVRVGGKHLYERARAGEQVEAPERTVYITSLDLLEFVPGEQALVRIDVVCSKGTYIRSLAEMLGQVLGCGGYLSALLRTRVGSHRLDQAVTLEQLAADPTASLLDPASALPHLPVVSVSNQEAAALRHGQSVALRVTLAPGPALVLGPDRELLCLAEVQSRKGIWLQPRKVW